MNKENEGILRIIALAGNISSIVASLFSFMLFWFFKESRSFLLEVQVYFVLFSLIYSISSLLPYRSGDKNIDNYCKIQAFLSEAGQLGTTIISALLNYCCLISIINKNHFEKYKMIYRVIFSLILLLPFGIASPVFIKKSYGKSYGICWLDLFNYDKRDTIRKIALIFVLCEWYFLFIGFFLLLKRLLIRKKILGKNKDLYLYCIYYTVVIVICRLFFSLNRLLYAFLSVDIFVLSIFDVSLSSIQGVLLMLIFIFSPTIYQNVFVFCQKVTHSKSSLVDGSGSVDSSQEGSVIQGAE